MTVGNDLTTYDAALKQHYTDDRVENMVYKRNPLLALLPKYENFGGRNLPIPVIYGDPQGRSKTFSNAKTRGAATGVSVTDFVLTRAKDYSIATLDNETLEASKGDANAFMDAATTVIDGAINALTRSIAVGYYRDSNAWIAQILAEPTEVVTTFVFTCKSVHDITNFEVGQMLVIYSAASGGTKRNSDGTDDEWVVAAIDRDAGTVSLTGDYTSSGTIAANDYVFVEGDRGAGFSGLAGWIPTTAPGATAFFGVDRSVDVVRLGGLRYDATGVPIEEALIEADARVGREGWALDHFFMNPRRVGELKKSLGSKVQYVDLKATAHVSFRAVVVDGAGGPIAVVADHNCPYAYAYGLMLPMWKAYSLGKLCRVIDTDGNTWLRMADDDGVEIRYGTYSNLGCKAPGANIVVTL